jgi:polyhydroxyalkanoate synthesis repressor PhaR
VRYILVVARDKDRAVRLIKRYENRKLYDTEARRYVTLEDVGALVAAGHDVQVLDRRTGEDSTSLTLAQVVLEGIKAQTALVPRQVLGHLIRLASGPKGPGSGWTGPQEIAGRARGEAERIVGRLLSKGRITLEEALALRQDIAQSVHKLVAEAQEGLESRLHGLFSRAESRVNPSLHGLKDRLETLETYLAAPRPRSAGTGRAGKKPRKTTSLDERERRS